MTSGWDKSPGPGNDYNPGGGEPWLYVAAGIVVALCFVGGAVLAFG